jgi:succinate dehydrogenase/fumarate reductase flavoprotein subunit
VSDRSLIWNSDLIETLELDNLIAQASVTMHGATTARKAAAPTRTRTSRTATTRTG